MMDGDAIREVKRLAEEAADKRQILLADVEGQQYSEHTLQQIVPELYPPERLPLHTLSGLARYLEANRDKVAPEEVVVHVASPTRVEVLSGIKGARNQRYVYAQATAEDCSGEIGSGEWVPPDEMTIALMTLCAETDDRARAIALIGNVSRDESVKLQDDGFTQHVTQKAGVTRVSEHEVENPVVLAPYRTFREVEQPHSPFLLRFSGGGERPVLCALFEADAGLWQLEAVLAIDTKLQEIVPKGYTVIS
jgi:hypothetical protein